MASRKNRRTNGTTALYIDELRQTMLAHLPEATRGFREKDKRVDPWLSLRVRPEVALTVDALAQRFRDRTGHDITKSEVIAAALFAALPAMVRDSFSQPIMDIAD